MNEIKCLYNVLQDVLEPKRESISPIPLFSFEGLPGAGKTTQIQLVAEELNSEEYIAHYIDLPTESVIGKILKCMYCDVMKWDEVRYKHPWLNPVLLSADLHLAVERARNFGAKCALMSRGVLSTYYYNMDVYGERNSLENWKKMEKHMSAFYMPTALFFLDISEEEARQRILYRNRVPLRKMDTVSQMRKDKKLLLEYLSILSHIPVHFINASLGKNEVTKQVLEKIYMYLR